MYYARAVDNKLLVALSAIGAQQAAATESTAGVIKQILDYVSTYPNYGVIYHASDMVFAAHSDAGFHNESKGPSHDPHLTESFWNGLAATAFPVIN